MVWTTKVFGLLYFFFVFFFFFFCGKGCISANISHPSSESMASPDGDNTNTICNDPFYPVGDYCLFIDNDMKGTWSEMQDVCKAIGGDLVNLGDANTLYEISQYIKNNGMDDVSYWVGATDKAEEGKWVWSSDDAAVRNRTPLWGDSYGQQPDGGEAQNCAFLYVNDYHYMHDDSCDGVMYRVICQPTVSEESMPIVDLENNNTFPASSNECPFVMIGNACFQIFPERNYTWTEANNLCHGSSRHLAKIDDANLLGDIYDYLTEMGINATLWIDGTCGDSPGDYFWYDNTPVKRGTNYWIVKSGGSQEPDTPNGRIILWYGYSYLFSDTEPDRKLGAMCQYDM